MTPEQSKKLIGDYLLELQREMPRLSDGMPMSEYQIQAAQEAGAVEAEGAADHAKSSQNPLAKR